MQGPRTNEDTAAYVAEAYDQYLSRWETGENPPFEVFCAENGEIAQELRIFHQEQVEDRLVEVLEHGGGVERLDACCRNWPAHAQDLRDLAGRMQALDGLIDEPPTETPAAGLEGTRIGRYTIIGRLGEGTTGQVLRAWDDKLHREVALKLLKQRVLSDLGGPLDRVIARFVEEAQVTSQLDHPSIVPIHELGTTDSGQPFFTMKLVKGEPFSELIGRVGRSDRDWTLVRGLQVMLRVGEALSYAHHKRVIHRDVKPGNILVGRFGAVYLVDWGLTRVLSSGADKVLVTEGLYTKGVRSIRSPGEDGGDLNTKAGTSLGTPYYMSPEQARGDTSLMAPAVDIYGLGAVLYHMLTGEPPYRRSGPRDTVDAMLKRIDAGPPIDIAELAPTLDPALAQAVRRSMAHNPEDRFGTMAGFLAELEAVLEGGNAADTEAPEARLPPSVPAAEIPTWGTFLRHNMLVLALAAALIFVLGLWWNRILGPQ